MQTADKKYAQTIFSAFAVILIDRRCFNMFSAEVIFIHPAI